MNPTRLFLLGLWLALLGGLVPAHAEDIDIYSGSGGSAGVPNVLFIMDNSANFEASTGGVTCMQQSDGSLVINGASGTPTAMSGTVGGIEQCALWNVVKNLPLNDDGTARVNIGFMVYNGTHITDVNGSNCQGSLGGCLTQPLIGMTAANKTGLLNWIAAWNISPSASTGNVKAAGKATAATMQEAWAYYSGGTGLSGRSYAGIQPSAGCQKNYVIYVGDSFASNGGPGDPSSGGPASALSTAIAGQTKPASLTAAQWATETATWSSQILNTVNTACSSGGSTSFTFPSQQSTHENGGDYADEWARFMNQGDIFTGVDGVQSITTYTVGLMDPTKCKPEYAALLSNMATYGGGKYFFSTDYSSLYIDILKILNEVQAVNSVFASSSLPVSVNAQGTYLNQIYMGMFRPDANGNPRWIGNLKQYAFVLDPTTGALSLGDAVKNSALASSGTGFLSPNAISFWTCANKTTNPILSTLGLSASQLAAIPDCPTDPTNGFWTHYASMQLSPGQGYDLPDGEWVEKGGAAQQLRLKNLYDVYTDTAGSTTNPRLLYTCCQSGTTYPATLSASTYALAPENTAITDAMLGTGPRTVTGITSASTVTPTNTTIVTSGGASTSVTITGFSKSGSTVTASVSATDLAKLAVGSLLKVASGASKYDCNPCTVASINAAANSFTYSNSGGSGSSTGTVATIYTNSVSVLPAAASTTVGQAITFSNCATLTALNGTVWTVTAVATDQTSFTVSSSTSVAGASDASCRYTPNSAYVTTSGAHNFASGASVTISGATPAGYNGTWTITVTGSNSFTYQYTSAAPLAAFSGTASASSNSTTRSLLLKWARGEDNVGDESGPGGTVNIRPSVHGDVLHSRPMVINYGGSTGVVLFYGENGGVYHAVNGNQTASIGSVSPGGELWGFTPTELLPKLVRQHDNSPALLLPSTPSGIVPAPLTKDYFVDGPTGFYQLMDTSGTTLKAYIYLTMRRGGRFLYALNVTDPTAPKVLWKVDTSTTGMSELGQTWSQPKVARIKGHTNPVLIFGAGYDTHEDASPATTDTMGRGIFVLDALDGSLVWSATNSSVDHMDYAIPSDITLLDRNSDGYIDRLYVADTGGNVWRVDLEPGGLSAPSNWVVTRIARLGCDSFPCSSRRKFLYPPEVISTTSYDAVILGSGDREHPLATTSSDRLFMLKDTFTGDSAAAMTTPLLTSDLVDATTTLYSGSGSGYYISLASGEKIVNAPLVTAGYVYFGTNKPTPPSTNSCTSNLGEARGYKVNPFTGAATYTVFQGGGLPPSPVSGIVNIVKDSGEIVRIPFLIGGGGDGGGPDGGSALGGQRPPITVSTNRIRTYWYLQGK